jgi:hypothetical protein
MRAGRAGFLLNWSLRLRLRPIEQTPLRSRYGASNDGLLYVGKPLQTMRALLCVRYSGQWQRSLAPRRPRVIISPRSANPRAELVQISIDCGMVDLAFRKFKIIMVDARFVVLSRLYFPIACCSASVVLLVVRRLRAARRFPRAILSSNG